MSLKSDTNNGYFTWRPIYIFLLYLAQFFLEWEMLQTKVVEKIKTHILGSVIIFENSVVYGIIRKKRYRAGQTADDNRTWCMQIACCVPKATNTRSEHVILLAFPLQQWLHKCTPMFCHMYSVCLVWIKIQTLIILPIRKCKLCWTQNWQFTM